MKPGIMSATEVAAETEQAFVHAQDSINAAKRAGADTCNISRRSLYLLTVLAGHSVGLRPRDASRDA